MKKRILSLTILLLFSFSSFAFAEVYSISNNGNPTDPIIWGSEDKTKYICGLKVKIFKVRKFGLIVQKGPHGVSTYTVIPESYPLDEPTIRSVSVPSETVLGFQFSFLSGETVYEDSEVGLIEVNLCDGSSMSFSDPFPPPPPNPPVDEGGTIPPSVDWGTVDTSKPANACGQPRWTSPIRNWVDDIFCPVISFLDLAKAKLASVSLMIGQGLNIGQYFSIFGDLPTSWQMAISSLFLMITTLGAILIFRSAMRIYYGIKEGLKWW